MSHVLETEQDISKQSFRRRQLDKASIPMLLLHFSVFTGCHGSNSGAQ